MPQSKQVKALGISSESVHMIPKVYRSLWVSYMTVNNPSYFKATYFKKEVSFFLCLYSSKFTGWIFLLIIFKLFSTVTKNVRLTQLKGDKEVTKKKPTPKNKQKTQVYGPPFLKYKKLRVAIYILSQDHRIGSPMSSCHHDSVQGHLLRFQWHYRQITWICLQPFTAIELMSNNHMTWPSDFPTFAEECKPTSGVLHSKVPWRN